MLNSTSASWPIAPSSRSSWLIAVLMFAASVGAMTLRPGGKVAHERPRTSLESAIPRQFGEWREAPNTRLQLVNPQTRELLDKIYSEIVSRVYVHANGYRIMLSLAYGSDQRGSLQAHKPEVCYPAQGFLIREDQSGRLATAFGDIPVRRMFATMGARQEPLTYWFTTGDKVVQGRMQRRLAELSFGLTGRIPDGMLFRVSSIDPDMDRAYRMQGQFVDQLLLAVSPIQRKRLSGLGDS
jgi:EpsI family protein